VVDSLLPHVDESGPLRRPAVGYTMVLVAATLFAVNGSIAKVALASGLSSLRLTEVRSTGAFLGLTLIALVRAPSSLRVTRRELPWLAVFGVVGLAAVQLFYFLAIHRLAIGIALLIQFTGPVFVAIWARTYGGEHVRRRIWVSLALTLSGLALMVELWEGVKVDGLGVVFALLAAVVLAIYLLLAEHGIRRRDPISLTAWGFFFATIFWTIVQPWWSFPAGRVGATVSLDGRLSAWHLPVWALVLWIVVLGSIVPFALVVGSMRHISATRAGIAAMLEPVVATIVAWVWLRESLSPAQLAGAAVVLAGIAVAQTAR
jgi:drug/metabolite transporter (DMT)-like permease